MPDILLNPGRVVEYKIRSKQGQQTSPWSDKVHLCSTVPVERSPSFTGFYRHIFEGQDFFFNVRLPREEYGGSIEYRKYKGEEDVYEDDVVKHRYEIAEGKEFMERFDQVVEELDVQIGQSVNFEYYLVNLCGMIYGKSELFEYMYDYA